MARPSLHSSGFMKSGQTIGHNLPLFIKDVTSQIVVREEHTIALVPNLSKDGCRGICRVGDEFEIRPSCRPANGRAVLNDLSVEHVCCVVKMEPVRHAAPTDVEGDICGYRGAMHQGVYKCAKVPDLYVVEVHRCRCLLEVDLYAFVRNAYRPKQAAWSDTRVEIVDLIRRDNLPLVEIQSYEVEGAVVLFPVQPNVDALHKTHIDVEDEGGSGAGAGVCSCPGALEVSDSDRAMKISDRRWLGAVPGQKDMENFCAWAKGLDTAGNGPRSVVICQRQSWYPES